MELWLITGLLVCVGLAIFNTLQKYFVEDNSPITVAYTTNLLAALILAPIAMYYFVQAEFELVVGGVLLISGLFNAIGFYLLPLALSTEDLGVIAPTRGISPIAVAVIEPLFFVEFGYNRDLLLAGVLAGTGLYVAFSEDGILTPIKNITTRGVQYGLLSATALSGAIITDRFALSTVEAQPQVYACGLAATTALFLGILLAHKEDSSTLIPQKKFIPLGLTRAGTLGLGIFTLAIATGTEYNVLVQLSIPLSVLFGYFFLGEEKFTGRKLIGSLIIILGVYFVL